MNASTPRVSIVIPAYRSGATIRACLQSLERQTFASFEVIVVESSGDEATMAMIDREFPAVRVIRSSERLLPQAARNRGVAEARGELLVFTDPDIYLSAEWLSALMEAWEERGGVIVGSFACYGGSARDFGFHLAKFSKWLPAAPARVVDMAPSGNMLISRVQFEEVGGFRPELFIGDVDFSRLLRDARLRLWFEPRARGEHHHLYDLRQFCSERYQRGVWYGELRSSWYARERWRVLLLLITSVLPLRLLTNVTLASGRALRTGNAITLARALPVLVVGYAATLAGESGAFVRALLRRKASRQSRDLP